jgi:hypothetical protein
MGGASGKATGVMRGSIGSGVVQTRLNTSQFERITCHSKYGTYKQGLRVEARGDALVVERAHPVLDPHDEGDAEHTRGQQEAVVELTLTAAPSTRPAAGTRKVGHHRPLSTLSVCARRAYRKDRAGG